ncbi:MAG: CDP-glycerol:glycerophosphate glycerophosphotransferase, partial [Lachnospiraceae bacterium]|nr:CDP-glycerol:glycerophosphate glycerophosphotransferase [Lachnospiraceae bacterium]
MRFEYKVSIIVPVYNVSECLGVCLDSLLCQTMPKDEMEILLINDCSTDNSFEICKNYAAVYPVFKLFTKENEGLSATRNFGITRAKGKYLMYIDSDDTFAPETVKEVTDFFDLHYNEIDLVTYLDQPYKSGQKMKVHYRYQYMKKSGVYDLEQYPYISQTRVNICVKNIGIENYLFDTTPGFRLEDQEYCSKVLRARQKIGFCEKGEYQYNRSNEGSIVSNYFYAYYIFESSMEYFERLFAGFEGNVPKYYQAMFFNDLQWKHNENKLYPYHYPQKQFQLAMNRIQALLARVDADVIYNHPQLDNFNKHYWLRLKPNVFPIVQVSKEGVGIYADGYRIYFRKNFELIMHKLRVHNHTLHFMAFIKSPVYTYLKEKAHLFVVENGNFENKHELNVFESIHSYYKSSTKTCNFYAFSYHCDVESVREFCFYVELDGLFFDTVFWCMPVAVFNKQISSYIRSNVRLQLKGNIISLERMTESAAVRFEEEQTELFSKNPQVYALRKESLNYRREYRIWLYYDLHTVEKDNGYYQFQNDIRHQDGIERYYIYDRELSEIEHLFPKAQRHCLIRFGSVTHKLLYLSAEKVLTAFYGFSTISPFGSESEEANYLDIIHFETIYLQHGVLHADLRLRNHAERCRADRIVISSAFEKQNYMQNYAYEENELICTGMARYDHIDRNRKPKNRILFAPSWREYLTFVRSGSQWEVLENKIALSDYYQKFVAFLTSDRLYQMLEDNNLHLDFKLHPIISGSKNLFHVENDRIHMAPDTVQLEDYRLFITDISSFVFDFVWLQRPVLYFMPDMDQFLSGMNHYRRLDLPFE